MQFLLQFAFRMSVVCLCKYFKFSFYEWEIQENIFRHVSSLSEYQHAFQEIDNTVLFSVFKADKNILTLFIG